MSTTRGKEAVIGSREWTVVDELSINVRKPGLSVAVEPGRPIYRYSVTGDRWQVV